MGGAERCSQKPVSPSCNVLVTILTRQMVIMIGSEPECVYMHVYIRLGSVVLQVGLRKTWDVTHPGPRAAKTNRCKGRKPCPLCDTVRLVDPVFTHVIDGQGEELSLETGFGL